MMLNSVMAVVENRNRHGNHFTLFKRQITITVHQTIVKSHQGPQSGRIQTMRFNNIIYPTPRAHRSLINLLDDARSLVFSYRVNPGHWETGD